MIVVYGRTMSDMQVSQSAQLEIENPSMTQDLLSLCPGLLDSMTMDEVVDLSRNES